jgi:hypothetical protein
MRVHKGGGSAAPTVILRLDDETRTILDEHR